MPRAVIAGPTGLDFRWHAFDRGTLALAPHAPPGPVGSDPEQTQRARSEAKPESTLAKPSFDIERAVEHLNKASHGVSQGKCARYVREALAAGGLVVPLPRPVYAKDYAPSLEAMGFKEVPASGYTAAKGDVAVIQAPSGRTEGHIQMFNGSIWVSDFRQRADIYPGPAYRNEQVAYRLFRFSGQQ
jgi:hypothetical protein